MRRCLLMGKKVRLTPHLEGVPGFASVRDLQCIVRLTPHLEGVPGRKSPAHDRHHVRLTPHLEGVPGSRGSHLPSFPLL